jgi:riboflavin synthase
VFTGIIQRLGVVESIESKSDFAVLYIDLLDLSRSVAVGDSVSVNGVCLTVTSLDDSKIGFDVMGITLKNTNLGNLVAGDSVNLELPMTLDGFVGGHMVQGHIDEVGKILDIEQLTQWKRMRISMSEYLSKYVVVRGSIAVDGVSLTVSAAADLWFEVSLIPATLDHTVLGTKGIGDTVNLESDIIARHLEKLVKS